MPVFGIFFKNKTLICMHTCIFHFIYSLLYAILLLFIQVYDRWKTLSKIFFSNELNLVHFSNGYKALLHIMIQLLKLHLVIIL